MFLISNVHVFCHARRTDGRSYRNANTSYYVRWIKKLKQRTQKSKNKGEERDYGYKVNGGGGGGG